MTSEPEEGLPETRLLTLNQVADYLSVDKATVLRWTRNPAAKFPQPIQLTASTKRWRLTDINQWIETKAQQ